MAHTNKTEPWFAKQRNPEFRHMVRVVHDHERGPCELAQWLAHRDHTAREHFRCYIVPVYNGTSWCSCRMCRGFYYDAPSRSRARRKAIQDQMNEAP